MEMSNNVAKRHQMVYFKDEKIGKGEGFIACKYIVAWNKSKVEDFKLKN
jgi:hypothetical protein